MSRLLALCSLLLLTAAVFAQSVDRSTEMFGQLRLIDEVIAGQEQERHQLADWPAGVSQVSDILGKPTRVIPNVGDESRYVAVRLGRGMNLQANRHYVLQVDYPEDAPRTMYIHNRAAETARGLSTGATVGDALRSKYVGSNPESINYPLSGRHETFQMLFVMQDKFSPLKQARGDDTPRNNSPADGVPVVITQLKSSLTPISQAAAFSRIALYEVVDPSKLVLKINYPPANLPRRHLFWREEMSDGVVGANDAGWKNDVDWYQAKAKLMQFLGMNTFTIDMLEFGHNQGWDSAPGGLDWVNQSHAPQRWENVLRMLKSGGYDFTVLPYYEYVGSVGKNSPGTKRFARPLGDEPAYTHITWSEKAYADVTEQVILDDAKKVLDLTITRWKDIMPFAGAWFRTRPSHMPVSFSDNALAKFAREANDGKAITRDELRDRGELYKRYIGWWNGQRKAFLTSLRDHLRSNGNDKSFIFFTWDASEAGMSLTGPGTKVVTDDPQAWSQLNQKDSLNIVPLPLEKVVADDLHLKAMLSPHPTWQKWEWEHSLPAPDPKNYANTEGVVLSYTFNRLYTVSSPKAFDAFRGPSGLGIVRHYTLNEHDMEKEVIGYFVMDVDRTRAHMMQGEALAMANGDPWYIGYLAGHSFNRGFPYYARRFNQAYLALPAMPSEVVADAASDKEVIVRAIKTPADGTWLAIVNTSKDPKAGVTVKLPSQGKLTDAATGQPIEAADGQLRLSLDAAELRSIRIQ